MIIEKINIHKFRGFENQEFTLGSQITIIAGQNGTQKTTILGLLTQPFTITDKENPMYGEKPLCGGNFKSAFSEKFKLSASYDKPKEHEWSLYISGKDSPYTVESIPRNGTNIRFWQKGSRQKGSGYIQLPSIYLSLKRLTPIGEESKIKESEKVKLEADEVKIYKELHNSILMSFDQIVGTSYIESINKNTLGVNTDYYDWNQNSAGQDNLSKIILSILSFKRLQKKYPNIYKGGILAIDEIDATMYPASQIKLLQTLKTYASKLNIQIILTTHSLSLLEKAFELKEYLHKKAETCNQIKIVFAEKKDKKIYIDENYTFQRIQNNLKIEIGEIKPSQRLIVYTEDKENTYFTRNLLKSLSKKLKFEDISLSCSNLVDLSYRKIPSFSFPNSLIILDGDTKGDKALVKKIKSLSNILILPGTLSPERLIAKFLYHLSDTSPLWNKINISFNKQYCFNTYSFEKIMEDRKIAKEWFNSHLKLWGKFGAKIFSEWIKENEQDVNIFKKEFEEKYQKYAKELNLNN